MLPAGLDIVTATLLALLGTVVAYSLILRQRLRQQLAACLDIEQRLRESESEYRTLIETAPFPIALTRVADNTLVFTNQRLLEQAQQTAGHFVGKTGEIFYEDPEDRGRFLAALSETGHISEFETCLRLPNGQRRWAYLSATFSRFNDEAVIFTAFNDISARKEIEKKLESSRRRLRTIFDNAVVGITLTTPDGRYLEVNAHWSEMLGYSSQETLAQRSLAIIYPDDVANSSKHLETLVAGEIDAYTLDQRYVRKDGSVFWANLSAAPIYDEQGVIESVVCVIQDINERKLADQRLQRILRELPIATIVLNWSGHLAHRSEKFEALFGYPYEEVSTIADWLPRAYPDPLYREKVQKTIVEMTAESKREGRASHPVELTVRCRDGSDKTIEFQYVDLAEEGIWTMNDVTGRNALAKAMRTANEHLMVRLGEIQELQEHLREQSIRDALTGLYNRRYLDEVFERELARAKREGHPLTVMMIDLDHFKKLNDTYGHLAGDEVLKALGDMLRDNARTEDIPCRYGGEEFLLVLPNMSLADARVRAEQWREKFAAMRIVFGQFSMAGTLSIGIATFPGHGRTRDELIEAADQALYAAKHNGRNRVEVCAIPA